MWELPNISLAAALGAARMALRICAWRMNEESRSVSFPCIPL